MGYLCAANRFDAETVLDGALRGMLKLMRLVRICMVLNGKVLELVLNDVLIVYLSLVVVSWYSVRLSSTARGGDGYDEFAKRFFYVCSLGVCMCMVSGFIVVMYSVGGEIMLYDLMFM